jgi:hypothetical protein
MLISDFSIPLTMPVMSANSKVVPMTVYVRQDQKDYVESLSNGRIYSMSDVVRAMIDNHKEAQARSVALFDQIAAECATSSTTDS